MSGAILPFEPTATVSGMAGALTLRFARRDDGSSVAADVYQKAPLRVQFPDSTTPGVPTAAAVNTAGGLVGGDHLRVSIAVEPEAKALVVAQAAEKVYRSLGEDSRIETALSVGAGGWLEWLPQETIVFEGARLHRQTNLTVAPDGRAMVGEMLVFGRTARGERLTSGKIRDGWEVRIGTDLAWIDVLHMEGDLAAPLTHPAAFDGALACATMIFVGPGGESLIEAARKLLPTGANGLKAAATVVHGVLVVRWLGRDALALRSDFGRFWAGFRRQAVGLPDRLPRLWFV